MFTSLKYVFGENFRNLYRIYCIAKYELLADMRDSKFGIFWNFASPAIQVLTYWLIFGLAWNRKPIGDIAYLPWLVIGYSAWWFVQPCIQSGCSAIFSKTGVITKIKFPVSILPATICAKEFFNHLCMLLIAFITIFICGFRPNSYWLPCAHLPLWRAFLSSCRFLQCCGGMCASLSLPSYGCLCTFLPLFGNVSFRPPFLSMRC